MGGGASKGHDRPVGSSQANEQRNEKLRQDSLKRAHKAFRTAGLLGPGEAEAEGEAGQAEQGGYFSYAAQDCGWQGNGNSVSVTPHTGQTNHQTSVSEFYTARSTTGSKDAGLDEESQALWQDVHAMSAKMAAKKKARDDQLAAIRAAEKERERIEAEEREERLRERQEHIEKAIRHPEDHELSAKSEARRESRKTMLMDQVRDDVSTLLDLEFNTEEDLEAALEERVQRMCVLEEEEERLAKLRMDALNQDGPDTIALDLREHLPWFMNDICDGPNWRYLRFLRRQKHSIAEKRPDNQIITAEELPTCCQPQATKNNLFAGAAKSKKRKKKRTIVPETQHEDTEFELLIEEAAEHGFAAVVRTLVSYTMKRLNVPRVFTEKKAGEGSSPVDEQSQTPSDPPENESPSNSESVKEVQEQNSNVARRHHLQPLGRNRFSAGDERQTSREDKGDEEYDDFYVGAECVGAILTAESSDGRGKYFGEIQIANEVRMRHGHGQLQLHNGSILLGQWVSNMLHGFAIQTNPDSSYCIGLYQNWVVEGPGWQYPARGGRYGYCGMFLNGRRCGLGFHVLMLEDTFSLSSLKSYEHDTFVEDVDVADEEDLRGFKERLGRSLVLAFRFVKDAGEYTNIPQPWLLHGQQLLFSLLGQEVQLTDPDVTTPLEDDNDYAYLQSVVEAHRSRTLVQIDNIDSDQMQPASDSPSSQHVYASLKAKEVLVRDMQGLPLSSPASQGSSVASTALRGTDWRKAQKSPLIDRRKHPVAMSPTQQSDSSLSGVSERLDGNQIPYVRDNVL